HPISYPAPPTTKNYPLSLHDALPIYEVIGVMNVQTVEQRDFGREEIDFLQTIANQVAGIIEKGRLQRESDRKLREVSALFEVSKDRKSTRLNSSHVAISYAVFCLKKK